MVKQDLREYFRRAHDAGSTDMYMAGEVPLAVRAAEAGADIIVARGTDAGLIDSIKSAEEVVRGMVAEAEEIIGGRFQGLLHSGQ